MRLRIPALALAVAVSGLAGCSAAREGPAIEVTARDFTFEGLPGTVEAGPVTFELDNAGREVHELHLFRTESGAGSVEELTTLTGDDLLSQLSSVGIASADPGDKDSFGADLEPGRYLAFCFVPVGTLPEDGHGGHEMDGDEHPPVAESHYRLGMVREFSVS